MNHAVVGIHVETPGQLSNVCRLIESLRVFGGAWRDAPVWVYKPEDVSIEDSALLAKLSSLGGEIRPSRTPADEQKTRACFHCGELVVGPEQGILRRWAQDCETLCGDSVLVALCKADRNNRVFLHQTP